MNASISPSVCWRIRGRKLSRATRPSKFVLTHPRSDVGLCPKCKFGQRVDTRKGSVFWLCLRWKTDPEFAKYPELPVLECFGFSDNDTRPLTPR